MRCRDEDVFERPTDRTRDKQSEEISALSNSIFQKLTYSIPRLTFPPPHASPTTEWGLPGPTPTCPIQPLSATVSNPNLLPACHTALPTLPI